MAESDWLRFGRAVIKTRTDIGAFLLFGGAVGVGDAIWNFAPYAEFYTLAPVAGALALGVKKLLLDRDNTQAATGVTRRPKGE